MAAKELDRASRASRGKRMSNLLDEEAEADDEFWNQDAFKEDVEDDEYATEDEEADVFDSDFDQDESDEEEAVEEDERRPMKKRKLPPGNYLEKKKKDRKEKKKQKKEKRETKEKEKEKEKKKGSSFTTEGVETAKDLSHSALTLPHLAQVSQQQENGEIITVDVEGERSVRKSTRTAVVIKQAEREAHQAALQALSKPVKKKKEEERKISQEEMLLEAAQTEIQNVQALEVMLAREEEVKRKATIQKAFYAGPQIRYLSANGKNVLEFIKVNELPEAFNSRPLPYPKKVLCVVTGLPAKYRDPKSNLPYATKEAFKVIRERFDKGENSRRKHPVEEVHQRKRTKVERERSGLGGRTIVTKLKYKKVITSGDDAASVAHPATFLKPTELEVQNAEQATDATLQEPVVDLAFTSVSNASKSSQLDCLQLPRMAAHDFSSLEMPGAFVEANEADFMLDDLEVSLPSNLESGLSLPTSMAPILLAHDSGGDVASDELEHRRLDATPGDQNQSLFSLPMLQISGLEGMESTGKVIL